MTARRTVTARARMAGQRRAAQAAIACGEYIAKARHRRRWSQHQLALKAGISQGYESQIERGEATQAPPEIWFALADALDVPLRFEFGRERLLELEDAGHLAIQEFMLALGKRTGLMRTFELTTPAE